MLKRALGATVSVCAFAMVMQSAAAQDVSGEAEPEMESRTLSTVTVTATRREENIQSTGASVSALDSEALLDRSVQSVEDVADFTFPTIRETRPFLFVASVRRSSWPVPTVPRRPIWTESICRARLQLVLVSLT